MIMHTIVSEITERIRKRSQDSRQHYLDLMAKAQSDKPNRSQIGCTNLAHVQAASSDHEKLILKNTNKGHNIAIVTAFNDMLSAHQPYYRYPEKIKEYFYPLGITAQVAGGVPAMCDGVTQGQPGMELSLFSRDAIALSTALALSHQAFDGMMLLGICDKIVPGQLMGALRFGHLPGLFLPAGPMPSGISNAEKAKTRQAHIQGQASDDDLLNSESAAYHTSGTCTFYGTANSNQMLLEAMGLVLPGSAFIQPLTDERTAWNKLACEKLALLCEAPKQWSLAELVNEKSIVNALVTLIATGGSTNLTIHWIAVAKAAGVHITWDDMNDLSKVVPTLTRVYPNGPSDINEFHDAGGTAWVFDQLISAGLLHESALTVNQTSMLAYGQRQVFEPQKMTAQCWKRVKATNQNDAILATVDKPFDESGGLSLLKGNLGKAIVKVSAVPANHRIIKAPARVFQYQSEVIEAYTQQKLNQNAVVVLKGQGPKSNGMPELHKLMPVLGSLQDAGFKVALLTDGRLSGASGKVLSAIHLVPEAAENGPISQIQDGDIVEIDSVNGTVNLLNVNLRNRPFVYNKPSQLGVGRELFSIFRNNVTSADCGAISIDWDE